MSSGYGTFYVLQNMHVKERRASGGESEITWQSEDKVLERHDQLAADDYAFYDAVRNGHSQKTSIFLS